uniref:Uncharacterized protein n=1 Tax=Nelumbo nucifera TaxID=4432 RepID=A0A822ZQA9_NELNU|nr:TPA_asm: hypothetical protein HUJ06_016980 [Nelumbo nucifera]
MFLTRKHGSIYVMSSTDKQVQPKPEAIRIKDCPIYEQLCTIFSEKGADGRYAQSSHYGESHKETTGMETPATASCPKSANTPFNPSRPSMFAQHDSSSPSRPDTLDGRKKRRSETQSGQGLRMRNCDGTTGDAIAEAMLEMAAASKLRAVAMTQANDQFSISGCIKALDEMQGVDQNIYFAALDLFENPNLRETFVSLKNEKRLAWLQGKCMALSGSMV